MPTSSRVKALIVVLAVMAGAVAALLVTVCELRHRVSQLEQVNQK
jgi:hypothetical protein